MYSFQSGLLPLKNEVPKISFVSFTISLVTNNYTSMMLRSRLVLVRQWERRYSELVNPKIIKERFKLNKEAQPIKALLNRGNSDAVVINGWIDKKPRSVGKGLIFSTLRDTEGDLIQLVDHKSLLKSASVEDVVQVEGHLALKESRGDSDPAQYELRVLNINTLNKSSKKPSQLLGFKIQESYPPEFRYLQLRLPKYQNFLQKRHQIAQNIRELLNLQGFLEVETPVLFKSTPEGAREFLVPARNKQDGKPTFYALPQSPQQYKQLLMASGIQKYYQFARCFRDEDLRSDRQPEFTQVDLEMAFASGDKIMHVVEDTMVSTWNKFSSSEALQTVDKNGLLVAVTGSQPVSRMSYKTAMTHYGIDKPDLRFRDLKIVDMSEFKARGKENILFPVFEVLILRNAFSTVEEYHKNWAFLSNEHNYRYRTPIVVPVETEELERSWFEKFLPIADFENPTLMARFLNLKKGDIVCGSTRQPTSAIFENPTPLGRLRQLAIQSPYGKKLYQKSEGAVATWVVDFPLFSPVEREVVGKETKQLYPVYESDKVTSTHHPFTMVQLDDLAKLSKAPLSCAGQHYDFVLNGVELGGGSTRIHDPELQKYVFKDILKIKEPEKLFGHLLTAFENGTPPHAGLAIGFDRMVAMICGSENIRDVIAFPKSVSGADLVVGSPSSILES
ncbi:aspartate--tRNA ligase MSD1 [Lachancea thermotolerans CBS 6340]|uniref:KLTH0E13530p n=1 Tax=Lachancea thermotolerans (strain ATCC 56472 / CBS 6340 / NRRL Y-8284) TaxID=559295 RepID=C5DIL8_LACTC|nr:KLTH0E13530p [Lachancea thermotolerans CBS 6340]CAR23629.1 KLTH0E13530p [Lachancea thermotolerans CBS 6340]